MPHSPGLLGTGPVPQVGKLSEDHWNSAQVAAAVVAPGPVPSLHLPTEAGPEDPEGARPCMPQATEPMVTCLVSWEGSSSSPLNPHSRQSRA